jgi:small subunit ribosomal protein S20
LYDHTKSLKNQQLTDSISHDMANTKSAKLQIKKIKTRTLLNKEWKSKLKTATKQLDNSIKSNNKDDIVKLSQTVKSILDKMGQRNIIHKNRAARLKSKLDISLNRIK